MTNHAPDASEDPKLTERIAQFENMTAADPENEMAHFSLGNAYMKAGRHAEAAGSLEKVTELNPDMSKAFQLAGESMIQAGWEDKAVSVLERGYEIAASKGDLMVRDAIETALEGIGRTPPSLSAETEAAASRSAEEGSFICRRTGKSGTAIEQAPFKGPVGAWIKDNISNETWNDWIGQGTKVINELRLDFSRDEDQATYERHMHEFLGIDDDLLASLGVTPAEA
jgi:Fe-S cluster biosynthesis and repair protein YggX